jgi:formate hydrogenlyase subunit 6/NADH:ubiquinone oxidoreductase subunit I
MDCFVKRPEEVVEKIQRKKQKNAKRSFPTMRLGSCASRRCCNKICLKNCFWAKERVDGMMEERKKKRDKERKKGQNYEREKEKKRKEGMMKERMKKTK